MFAVVEGVRVFVRNETRTRITFQVPHLERHTRIIRNGRSVQIIVPSQLRRECAINTFIFAPVWVFLFPGTRRGTTDSDTGRMNGGRSGNSEENYGPTSIMDSVHESFAANAKIDDIKVITRCYQQRRSHSPQISRNILCSTICPSTWVLELPLVLF